jgi:ribose transport system substrate-binding protein
MASYNGCGGNRLQDSPSSKKSFLVVFSQCNNAEPYRAAQNALMTQLWSANDDVQFEILDGQQDNSKQVAQIETAILRKPDLLIVAPNERGPLTKIMGKAMDAHIPVICLERDILEPNYTTIIRSDNEEIGRMVGTFIVDYLTKIHGKAEGKLVHMRGLLGVEGEISRHGGAEQILRDNPGIKVLREPVADWLQSRARERMAEVLSIEPAIDVVYGHNDPMAIGAYLAAKEAGREKEMIFIGVDGLQGPAGGIQKVVDGVLAATFVYPLCVDKAVEVGTRILRDPDYVPQKVYVVESTMVTEHNAAKLLH